MANTLVGLHTIMYLVNKSNAKEKAEEKKDNFRGAVSQQARQTNAWGSRPVGAPEG